MPTDDLSTPQFFLSEVAQACDINPVTLNQWLSRGLIVFRDEDRDAAGSGHRRLFTMRRVFQVAIASHLIKLGIATSVACNAATTFSDVSMERIDGSGSACWESEEHATARLRFPGELFAGASTYLLITLDSHGEPTATLHRIEKQSFAQIAGELGVHVDVSRVVWGVRQRLGLPARTSTF